MSQPIDKPIGKPMALMDAGRIVHKEGSLSVLIIKTLITWDKHIIQLVRGTQRLFSVKYLFGEVNIA